MMGVMKRQRGFTIIELVIAMAIFSFMAVILAAGIVRLYEVYQGGTAIRVSEQSAATVAQKITRDIQQGQVLAIGSGPASAPVSRYTGSAICILDPQNPTATSETLTGSIYFVYDNTDAAHQSFTLGTDQVGIYQKANYQETVPIDAGNTAPTQSDINANCQAPSTASGAQPISGTDTSAIIFSGQLVNPNGAGQLLDIKLSMAAVTDLTDLNPASGLSNPGYGVCNDGSLTQYCSVTNLTITSGTGNVGEGGS